MTLTLTCADVADGVTASTGTPGATGIQGHLCVEAEGAVLLHQLLVCQALHLGLAEDSLHMTMSPLVTNDQCSTHLSQATWVWTRDVIGSLHHLKADVLFQTLK